MRPVEPNPFADATFVELQFACGEAIRALERPSFDTAAEKRAFAKRLRFLLIAISMRLRCGPAVPGMPEMALTNSRMRRLSANTCRYMSEPCGKRLKLRGT